VNARSDVAARGTLVIGVPREVKPGEHRVAITPDGVRELRQHDVGVLIEAGAGVDSSISDAEYTAAGAELVKDPSAAWERADVVCKVKEPQKDEFAFLRPGLTLFTYLHLAAYPAVADELIVRRVTGIGFETVQRPDGALPLLAPMSEIAGRMAPQVGARFLERQPGGRGVLLGGAPGVRPARVVVLGAGSVGANAAWIAQGMDAEVVLLNRGIDRLRIVEQIHRGRIVTLASNRAAVERAVVDADLVVGAVLQAGARAPTLVSEDQVAAMKPGSVIVDVAVDQGGCVETTHETTHADPVYECHGVLHYAVGNMPGAVPHTSTYALANATLPYLVALATRGVHTAIEADSSLARGVNTCGGAVTSAAVAGAIKKPSLDLSVALDATASG
jgi:alanine dehydrogenase